jgi:hypothetical protein
MRPMKNHLLYASACSARGRAAFEDACHDGNYSLKHILEGGRVRDGTLR